MRDLRRSLCLALACASLSAVALGQGRTPPTRDAGIPKRIDQSPFRRIDIGDLRIELMALNDEACPLQLQSGRVGAAAGRHRALWVEVKSVAAQDLASYALVTMVFDPAGHLRTRRHTSVGERLRKGKRASVELTLDYDTLGNGDRLVVAVERAASAEDAWRSDPEELEAVATERVRAYF